MTAPLQLLVIEPSGAGRVLHVSRLGQDPVIELGEQCPPEVQLARLVRRVRPDAVALDLCWSYADGLAAVDKLYRHFPHMPILLCDFRQSVEHLAKMLVKAGLGTPEHIPFATSIPHSEVVHPRGTGGSDVSLPASPARAAMSTREVAPKSPHLVCIGASTGGPNALDVVLRAIPADFPVPIAIVLHIPPEFVASLADRLNGRCQIDVVEAVAGVTMRPGTAYIAPGGIHLGIRRLGRALTMQLLDLPPEQSCKPAVDVLFRTAAAATEGHLAALVLTGMGSDGTAGARTIREQGGQVLVQDAATSTVWGMPGSVAKAGLADAIVPLAQCAERLVAVTRAHHRFGMPIPASTGGVR